MHQLVTSLRIKDDGFFRKTKIIATIGPASDSPEVIEQLILNGVNLFRFNFSHGSHSEHKERLDKVRKVAEKLKAPIATLQDLSGPKIRITEVDANLSTLVDGQTVCIKKSQNGEKNLSNNQTILVEGLDPSHYLKPAESVLLDDGSIVLKVESVTADEVIARVRKGGVLRSKNGIAFPDSEIDLPATTEKDIQDLNWGLENEIDYVAISFVNCAKDLKIARDHAKNKGKEVSLIAKIERRSALENIDQIIEASDGIMVARGDLGLELPLETIPAIQRRLIEACNRQGKPVIVATQLLHSMIKALRPTRAEVSDVASAVMGGADAVMLSEETAIGQHPVESVEYLAKIAQAAEQVFNFEEYRARFGVIQASSVPEAIAYAACAAAVRISADALVVCTETGNSARLVAKYRPQQPFFAVTHQQKTFRKMSLFWGLRPILAKRADDHASESATALSAVQKTSNLPNGSLAVITGGMFVNQPGSTNILEIRKMEYL
ncbi:MAG TPA: pyruvate kinase [Oligoflexia bacterium]|nr:pyruvate kinase [Oligoflexia bacterium]HMP27509.1 pyruvate kinase [Oligoflexia bacterium]